ncbi:MAG: hypothetical protein U0744_11550 [Gemmataceae bacterium]
MSEAKWIRSVGSFRFSPEIRKGSHQRRDGGTTKWWLIIDCDPELGRLFRHLYMLGHFRTRTLQPPLWGPHVSVIRGEEPANAASWGLAAGEAVEFEYSSDLRETDGYVWCAVECPRALAIREALNLPRSPQPPLHLSIGNSVAGP